MLEVVCEDRSGIGTWVDVTSPDAQELGNLAKHYGLSSHALEDCLEPDHMPKFERVGASSFAILRVYDESAPADGATPQALTRKLAVFAGSGYVLTIHRTELPLMQRLRDDVRRPGFVSENLFYVIIRRVLDSYDRPLQTMYAEVAAIEGEILGGDAADVVQAGYKLRRRASVYRYLLAQTLDIVGDLEATGMPPGLIQDLRDRGERLHYHADTAIENLDSLLTLHLSLATARLTETSNAANEVMRILTVFSAFFLPLNFIAGVYGMNFEHMPELAWRLGYPLTLLGMAAIGLGIFLFFKRRGFLLPVATFEKKIDRA